MTNPTPSYRVLAVTPELARKWLAHNKRNRNVSDVAVARYRSDMIEGRWAFAGDPIRFDIDGNLIDGQHRLHALATCPEATAIDFMVITKLPTETQMVMDQGRRRTPGDQLGLIGVKDANVVGAGARVFIAHESGLLFRDNKDMQRDITTSRIEEWVRDHMSLVEQASSVPNYRMAHCPASVSYAAALLFVDHIGIEATIEFFRLLHAGTSEGHPINTLDRRLRRIKDNKTRTSQRELLALFIQAMNAWLDGKTITRFQMPHGARWTESTFPHLRRIA